MKLNIKEVFYVKKQGVYTVKEMANELAKRNIDVFTEENEQIFIDDSELLIEALEFDFEMNTNEGPFPNWTFHGEFPDQALISNKEFEEDIFESVADERTRQDEKWGIQNHPPLLWLSILSEEVGEVAKELNEFGFSSDPVRLENARTELIQTAAVAIAFADSLSRNQLMSPIKKEGGNRC